MGRSRSIATVAALFAVVLSLTAPTTAPAVSASLKQSVSLQALPQLADPGATPRPAAVALTTLDASFAPVVPGRVSILEVKRGRDWVEVARGSQDLTGRSIFQAAYANNGTPETYRVVAARTSSYQQATSGTVSTSAWGVPIFSDEFSGTALSWPWDQRYQGYEVASRSCSKTDPRASVVGAGVLSLKVLDDPERDDVCNYTVNDQPLSTFYRINGHVGTHGRFAYRYGVAAARIKFQGPRGQHGAFWMQPQGTGGAEIDVIEWFGTISKGLASGVWDYSSGTPVRKAGGFIDNQPAFGSGWAETYHVFSVEWTPTEYIFRIDGKVSLRTTAGVSQTEEYLILSLLVSNWEAANLPSPDSLPTSMDVDWVRVWQKA